VNKYYIVITVFCGLFFYIVSDLLSLNRQLEIDEKVAKVNEVESVISIKGKRKYKIEPLLPIVQMPKKKQESGNKNKPKPIQKQAQNRSDSKRVGDFIVTLFSTSYNKNKWQAVVKVENKKTSYSMINTLNLQDKIDEFAVSNISNNELVLESGNKKVSLKLFDFVR